MQSNVVISSSFPRASNVSSVGKGLLIMADSDLLDIDSIVARNPKACIEQDDFGHPKITSIFKFVANQNKSTDRHHILEFFSKVVKQVEAKDGKISMQGWDCIHYGKDKNGRLISGGKEWTLKKICDTINNHTSLREFVIAESFYASCTSGRPETCPPKAEDLPELMYGECANSYDIAAEMIKMGNDRYSDITLSSFNNTNAMRVCDTNKELRIKEQLWIKKAKRYLDFLGVDFDEDAYRDAIHSKFEDNFKQTTCAGKSTWVLNRVAEDLSHTHDLVEQALGLGLVHGYNGGPGRGKTHCALNDVASVDNKAFGWALSNQVAFSMKGRGSKIGIDVEPSSFSRVLYMDAVDHDAFIKSLKHPIMIDETSQMGLGDLRILDIALEAAIKNNIKVILMGDLNQIPSFLSRGSLLYSLITEFPDMFTELTVNHRVDESSRDMVTAVDSFAESGKTECFSKYKTDRITVSNIISDCDNSTVFICGSNYQASCTSQDVLRHKIDDFNPQFNSNNWFSILFSNNKECVQRYMRSNNLKFRAGTTATYVDLNSKKRFKVRTNEQYLVSMYERNSVAIESLLTGEHHVINYSTLCIDFEPAYAITANRAEGLEWDTVVIMYGDYYTKSEKNSTSFKSNYPIRNSFEHLYVSCSRAKKAMFMYYGNERDAELVPLTKYNMFDII